MVEWLMIIALCVGGGLGCLATGSFFIGKLAAHEVAIERIEEELEELRNGKHC